MAVPSRPVSGQPIETTWGDIVHDSIVAVEIQYGSGLMAFANSPVATVATITFPHPFGGVPVCFATMGPSSTAGANANVGLTGTPNASAVTFQGREVRESAINGSFPFNWVCIGPRA